METTKGDDLLADGNAIAVFTSGGDAPGMNAVVRGVCRTALHYGRPVYAIYEGYQGLVDGGEFIRPFTWEETQMIIHQGGTVIGSARCLDFRQREGRLRACKNLILCNITNLVCCGGDGSLTGANIFKLEWESLVAELLEKSEITREQAEKCAGLNLVGCVGSIDNDMVYDGTLTIGTDTALHRIVDAIDAVTSTASSHQRTFVLEIMGRHCGYLAWAAGVATGADFILIPESPPKVSDWESLLCAKLDQRRKRGARLCTVLVAEGAIDINGNPITTEYVRQVIVDRLKHDTRATILGHVQRGGHASCYDRLLGTVTGAMAVEKVLRADPGDRATIVGVKGSLPTVNDLVQTVADTQAVAKFSEQGDFLGAIKARKKDFQRNYEIHKAINRDIPKVAEAAKEYNVAVLCSGAPAAGMNACIRAVSKYVQNFGHRCFAVHGGFAGLAAGELHKMDWMEASSWSDQGGCNIRTDRRHPTDIPNTLETIKKHNLNALCVIGGFDALRAVYAIREAVHIPVAYIPATISNNVPGTDFSLGCDTALNAICAAIDTCKRSADSSSSRVFIIETQGRNSGFLAVLSALSGGADIVYTKEEGVSLQRMCDDIALIKNLIQTHQKRHFVVVRNEMCNDRYDLNFMENLFAEEGSGVFTVRTVKLGHLCQGDIPSPLDRVRAALFGGVACRFLIDAIESKSSSKVVVGLHDSRVQVVPVDQVAPDADWTNRVPLKQKDKWGWILALFKHLAGYGRLHERIEDGFKKLMDQVTVCKTCDD